MGGTIQGDIFILNSSNMRMHSVVKKPHIGLVTALAFSQDSKALVSASLDSSARLASSVTEEKKNTCKNMSSMFDVLRRNRTVKLETLVLNGLVDVHSVK
uniref:Anaphase-promoting complex subunit 4 WD40 domain-containing protein n=1 Tax=Lactuca sativa TaxID=4236 RepID=A0A9R1V0Q8_LACSA|nr:hypothetical protein LSAT_V11C700363180 [Lactuca sativa]